MISPSNIRQNLGVNSVMPPAFGFEVQLLYDMLRAEHDRAYLLYLPKRKATEYPLGPHESFKTGRKEKSFPLVQ